MSEPLQRFRIETSGGRTQIVDADGNSLGSHVFAVDFRHHVSERPTLTLRQYLTDAVLSGDAVVERVTLCPGCRQPLPTEEENTQIFYLTDTTTGTTSEVAASQLLGFAESLPKGAASTWLISTAKP